MVERRYPGEPVEVVLDRYQRLALPNSKSPAIPPRSGVPLICPGEESDRKVVPSRRGWNAKQVVGMGIDRAERLGARHGCRVRPVWADGSHLGVRQNLDYGRVNVALRGKRIVRTVGLG